MDSRKRWWALTVVCFGNLMIVLDSTIVNVALPSIRADLGLSEVSLVWVVNAYQLTFGGFLLLGGRLGDLFGHRRLFLLGIMSFTMASLGCGVAGTQALLIGARAVQGVSGAVVSAVSLSLTMNLFTQPSERAKAMSIFGFVGAGGGGMGLLLSGVLTSMLSWHWIFLVNVPVGIVVCALSIALLPDSRRRTPDGSLDIVGAVTVTTSLMVASYAIVNGNEAGSTSLQTLVSFTGSALLMILFLGIEARVRTPLLPLNLLRLRNLVVANIAGALWAAALFAWFFNSALYLRIILGYSPLLVGLVFLPANVITAAFSLGISSKLVIRLGVKLPLAAGLLLVAVGFVFFGRTPVNGRLVADVLPGILLIGLGGGMAFTPLLLAAMSGVAPRESGAASGMINTALTMGGALGLAILVSVAGARTKYMLASGADLMLSLNSGYHMASYIAAGFAFLAASLTVALLRSEAEVSRKDKTGIAVLISVSDD